VLEKAQPFPRTWVPLASIFELDPDRPTPLRFLDQPYVAFRDNEGEWRVMDDACPHRLAPLSEGRIDRETNRIECAYHGWQFEPKSGACKSIPQATDSLAATAFSSPRACVGTYATRIEKSILWAWLWPEDPLTVVHDPMKLPEGMLSGVNENPNTYTRDLPYGWDTLLENIVDPSHIPFAHHGLQGTRNDAIPINMTTPKALGEHGFRFEWQDRTMGKRRGGTGNFRAPYVVSYNAEYETGGPPFNLTVVCIPTAPGYSRAIVFAGGGGKSKTDEADSNADSTAKASPAEASPAEDKNSPSLASTRSVSMNERSRSSGVAGKIFKLLPPWVLHVASNRFLDSDLAFLHYQEQTLRSRGATPDGAASEYFMPAPADRCIAALRSWIKQYAHVLGPLPPAEYRRSVLFDRWTQHTSHCKHCQAAVDGLQVWRKNTLIVLALSLIGGSFWWGANIVSVLCIGMLSLYLLIEQQFKDSDYKHYLS
jgi:phenylpropionate dioxygenase-like ring-hydroxylating dioxygenase large terminal subunit